MENNTQMLPINLLEVNKGQIDGLPKNPRFIRDERFAALVKSIKDAPEMLHLRELLVVKHGKKYVTIGGNMRLRACQELGYEEVPCKVLADDTPTAKLREYAIKDNNGFGQDDWDILANEWDAGELQDWGMELPTDWDLDGGEHTEAVEDDFDEATVTEAVCKRGEVWKLGEHRLMCGDSTSKEDFAKLMGEERADMVFTDPPYNVEIVVGSHALPKINRGGQTIMNDKWESDEQAGQELWLPAFTCMREYCKDQCAIYVTMPQGGTHMMMMMMMAQAGWQVKHEIIWRKNSLVLGRQDYNYQHEPICYGWNKTHKFVGKGKWAKTSVWEIDRPTKSKEHPTMKPVELVVECMLDNSDEGDIVLDAFGGSGTTMVAAEQLGRKCRMMELDPHYCDVIIARWEQLTGLKAERIEDGEG